MARKPAPKKKASPAGRKPAPKKPAAKKAVASASGKAKTPAAGKGKKKPVAGRPSRTPQRKTAGPSPAAPKRTTRKPARAQNPISRRNVDVTVEKKKDRLQELKKSLLKRKESIIAEAKLEIAKYISGENRQLVDTAIDEGDLAMVDISEDINLRRLDAHRKTLRDIDEVLRKLNEGTYGICEECGEEISEKRLKVIPTASRCIACQENKEQMEAFEKEEAL